MDRLPTPVQSLITALVPLLVTWATTDLLPWAAAHPEATGAGALATWLALLGGTRLTTTWGVGAGRHRAP